MKILIITNLFPNKKEPNRAVFNKQQFLGLSKFCELKVVAPIPYFSYSKKQVPEVEIIDGIEVYYPRYLVIPKILRALYSLFFFFGVKGMVRNIYKEFRFEKILASWAYPDGCASAKIASDMKMPLIMKVHGSDINYAEKYFMRKAMIVKAFNKASRIIAVSSNLIDKITSWGIPQLKIVLLPNGVDKSKFYPMDKKEARNMLGLADNKKYILFIGNFVEVKGIEYLIEAFMEVQGLVAHDQANVELVLIGDGILKKKLKETAEGLGVISKVHFKGRVAHSEIPVWLNAVDVFCLPSLNEGCPNVVLEALACGTPVVASCVGGVPDFIKRGVNGFMVEPKDINALSEKLKEVLLKDWHKEEIALSSAQFEWRENAEKLLEILHCVQDDSHSESVGRRI